jgi:uncharacterized protein with GYD domain
LNESGEKELLAIAKSKAPQGRARWTLELLAGELVRLKVVEAISHETVRKVLKKLAAASSTSRLDHSSRR